MRKKVMLILLLFTAFSLSASNCVVLLHGIHGSAEDMNNIAVTLQASGYETHNLDYPSTEYPIEILAEKIVGIEILKFATEVDTVHFAAHSMGNIVVRYFLKNHPDYPVGRIVMLGPPNQGSELTDKFMGLKFYQKRYGPAGNQIGTNMEKLLNLPKQLPKNCGIIAGTKTMFFLYSWILPGKDDGKVTYKRMKSPGYTEFITVPHHHDEMTFKQDVGDLVLSYINNGVF